MKTKLGLFKRPQRVQQTSRIAYSEIQESNDASNQAIQVYHKIKEHPEGITRNELSRVLKIPINAICGRVNTLLSLRQVYEDGVRKDQITRKINNILFAVI